MKLLLFGVTLLFSLFEIHAQYVGIPQTGGSILPPPRNQSGTNSGGRPPVSNSGGRPPVTTRRPPVTNSGGRPPVTNPGNNGRPLEEVFNWNIMDFNFPSEAARQEAISSGSYDAVNVSACPAVVEAVGSNSRIFVTIPRWFSNGVPATLSTIQYPSNTRSPRLTPYPSWEFNRQGNCNGLTSVYRVKVDDCNRLWVLDNGVVNNFNERQTLCPSQIYAFDLSTDQVIHRFVFPNSVIRPETLLVTIEVEYPSGRCGRPSDAVIYVADSDTYGLIVADMSSNTAWRIGDKTMYPSPEGGTISIVGTSFELMDGVFGLALSPNIPNRPRTLYYSSLNDFTQHWVQTAVLRNESLATNSPTLYQSGTERRSSLTGDTAINQQGVMFFGLLNEQAIACWNTARPFQASNIAVIARNDDTLQFPVSIQVDTADRLWVMSTRFQRFAVSTITPSETNFRVFMAPSADLVRGTVCQP